MFLLTRHFAEGALLAVGQEYRVIAETAVAARWPYQRAGNARFEFFALPLGPGEAQRRDKMRAAALGRGRPARLQLLFDRFHGAGKVAIRTGPARGVNSRRTVERLDGQSGIIGERRQPRRPRRSERLDAGVVPKRRSLFAPLGP